MSSAVGGESDGTMTLQANIDHLHRRAYVIIDNDASSATMSRSGKLIYLACLYGWSVWMMHAAKIWIEENPTEFIAGANPSLEAMARGVKSKAIDELLAHRVYPAFLVPAFGVDRDDAPSQEPYSAEDRSGTFIYPRLKRVGMRKIKSAISQQQLFSYAVRLTEHLDNSDIKESVTRGENLPFDRESMRVFSAQQMERNIMLMAFESRASPDVNLDIKKE